MKVIVMGCGRVGQQVSQMLTEQGHEVTVIDHDDNAIARLGPDLEKVRRRLARNSESPSRSSNSFTLNFKSRDCIP